MDILFISLLLASPVLWLGSLLLLKSWHRFWPFFALNALLLVGYLGLFSSGLVSLGHDEYGLNWLFAVLSAIVLHTVLGFGFAVGYRLYRTQSLT